MSRAESVVGARGDDQPVARQQFAQSARTHVRLCEISHGYPVVRTAHAWIGRPLTPDRQQNKLPA